MTKEDYKRFLYKIDQLNQLVNIVEDSPEKFQLIIKCKSHEDVVKIAKEWGYEIGRRWGED